MSKSKRDIKKPLRLPLQAKMVSTPQSKLVAGQAKKIEVDQSTILALMQRKTILQEEHEEQKKIFRDMAITVQHAEKCLVAREA